MSFKKLINFKYIELLEIGAKTSGEFILIMLTLYLNNK